MYPVFQICIPFGNTEEPACTKKDEKKNERKNKKKENSKKRKGEGKGRSNTMVYEGGREIKK